MEHKIKVERNGNYFEISALLSCEWENLAEK